MKWINIANKQIAKLIPYYNICYYDSLNLRKYHSYYKGFLESSIFLGLKNIYLFLLVLPNNIYPIITCLG